MTAALHHRQFHSRQRFTMMVDRYEVLTANPDGSTGSLLAFAEQQRFALKERVTFFADASRTQAAFGVQARQLIDLSAGYDITDGTGQPIGFVRKDCGASLLRSTFHLEGPGYAGADQERNRLVAMLRRFTGLAFLPVRFDFVEDVTLRVLMSSTRQPSVRDKDTITVPDQRADFRVAAAVAVALDALMLS
jgi:hypothetical protein